MLSQARIKEPAKNAYEVDRDILKSYNNNRFRASSANLLS